MEIPVYTGISALILLRVRPCARAPLRTQARPLRSSALNSQNLKIKNNMNKRKEPTLHEKAIRLLEGGAVEINGNYFKAERLADTNNGIPCWYCNLICRCQSEVEEMCNYLDGFGKGNYVLNLLS